MWIEIFRFYFQYITGGGSCHVCGMWIEIMNKELRANVGDCHATYVACGLKLDSKMEAMHTDRHATYVACGLKYPNRTADQQGLRHATYVACGLK